MKGKLGFIQLEQFYVQLELMKEGKNNMFVKLRLSWYWSTVIWHLFIDIVQTSWLISRGSINNIP